MNFGMNRSFFLLSFLICCGCLCQSAQAQDEYVYFTSSDLPIVLIDTHGQDIPDNYKLLADMGIVFNGTGMRNDTSDTFNNYLGKIAIERRGSSSQMFPKKQYGLELQNDTGTGDSAVSLLGMPEEEDWILFAPYNDKALMRDVLAYKLGRDLGRYAPRTRFCELFLKKYDESLGKTHYVYQGIYVLIEKIKRDANRVDIAKLNPDETTGDDVTGGYILKIDKTTGSSGGGWGSPYLPPDTEEGQYIFFQYEYPQWDEIVGLQKKYIVEFVTYFEKALNGVNFKDKVNGYAKYIDVDSFIDFMIMQEVTRNVDGYRLSTFMYKQKDSDGGKLVMGPIWDFNLGFGNADYCSGWKTYGWMYDEFNAECGNHGSLVPFWWRRLMQDNAFREKLSARWNSLRQGKFSTASIHHDIDSIYTLLNHEAAPRNFQAWKVLGEYVWPNQYVGDTFEEEIQYLKSWISQRMAWMDVNIPATVTDTEPEIQDFSLTFYPHPIGNTIQFEYEMRKPGKIDIQVVDITGRSVAAFSKVHPSTGKYHESIDARALAQGIHLVKVQINGGEVMVQKLVKRKL
jgi:hypothetical protein